MQNNINEKNFADFQESRLDAQQKTLPQISSGCDSAYFHFHLQMITTLKTEEHFLTK